MSIRLLTCAAIIALVATACGSDDAATISEPATGAVDPAVPDPSQQEPSDTADHSESPTAPEAVPEPDAEPAASEGTAGTSVSEDGTVSDGTADDSTAAAPADPGDVPDFEMINVHTDAPVNLQSVVDGETPLLLWFWAPH